MDTSTQTACNEELFNPVLSMGAQVSCILVISHFFQLILKPLGQPGPLSQILAGFVLGPSGLSRIDDVKRFFLQNFTGDYYETMALYARIAIMFLIGLELDIDYLKRNLRKTSIVSFGGCLMCTIFGIAITAFMYEETGGHGSAVMMALIIIVILANTASPIVIRLAADLKFATSDIGRLAISSALIGDIYAVMLLFIVSRNKHKVSVPLWIFYWFLYFGIVIGVIIFNGYLVNWLNRRNVNNKYLKHTEFFFLLGIVFATALVLESLGFSSIIGCFLIGSMFPRRGKSARTLLAKLTYSVHNFIIPIYFGYTGFRADITSISNWSNLGIALITILLSIGGKISGTLFACHYLRIPLNEGVLLAFLMNLKGHVDIVTLVSSAQNKVLLSQTFLTVMTATAVINSLIMGPLLAFMVKRENDILGNIHSPLEMQNPESELRMLSCVHSPRPVATMLGLIAAARGSTNIPITPYLMHLIELPEKRNKKSLDVDHEEDEMSDEEDFGAGNEVVEINEKVDFFTADTGIMIQQVKVVSPFATMSEDVCEFAEDLRTSIIILPFHKHQRIDLKLENGKEGIRSTNQKIMRRAQCSVSILVDRGLSSGGSNNTESESLRHVAVLFFGGPDDREALGFSKRLRTHHHMHLTIIRFLPASSRDQNAGVDVAHQEENVLMDISDHQAEAEVDNSVLTDFYNRYVASGQVGFVEKHVKDGAETASALRDMADMYSLFIVGKGGGGHSPLTTGISDWEECPELGTVGDFLASAEFDLSGSVLVIQQRRYTINDDDDVNEG